MTNKIKLIFVITAAVSSAFFVLMSTPFALDIADRALSTVANALSLHEEPTLSALAILLIPAMYLYCAFRQRRHI